MNKSQKKLLVLIGVSVLLITGCGANLSGSPDETNAVTTQAVTTHGEGGTGNHEDRDKPIQPSQNSNSSPKSNRNDQSNQDNIVSGDSLYNGAALSGHVVDFTENGCTISPIKTERVDEGEVAAGAAPGSEDMADNITITYAKGCVFEIADINSTTYEANLKSTSLSDVKKTTSLIIHGDFQNTHHVEATRVIIERFDY